MNQEEKNAIDDIIFLEMCLKTKYKPETLTVYKNHYSPKVRALAASIENQFDQSCCSIALCDDPSFSVRKVALRGCKNLSILKKHLKDANSCVKLALIDALKKMELTRDEQNIIIGDLLPLINDKEVNVRLEFVKILCKFDQIDSSVVVKMFDKEDIGTFIYGAEDESIDVRRCLIQSMKALININTADITFGYLCDVLHDDSEEIRIEAIKLISCICKQYTIKRTSKELFGLLLSANEKDSAFKQYLFKILTYLRFADISAINHILHIFDQNRVIKLLRKVILNNKDMFENEIMHKGAHVFSLEEHKDKESIEYKADLVIAKTLIKYNTVHKEILLELQNEFDLIKHKDISTDKLELKKILYVLKKKQDISKEGFLVNCIEKIHINTPFVRKIQSLCLQTIGNFKNIVLIPFLLNFPFKAISYSDDLNEQKVITYLSKVIKLLIKHKNRRMFRTYSIDLKSNHTDAYGLFSELEFELQYPNEVERFLILVLEKHDSKIIINAQKSIKLTMNDTLDNVIYYFAIKNGNELVKVTKSTDIKH